MALSLGILLLGKVVAIFSLKQEVTVLVSQIDLVSIGDKFDCERLLRDVLEYIHNLLGGYGKAGVAVSLGKGHGSIDGCVIVCSSDHEIVSVCLEEETLEDGGGVFGVDNTVKHLQTAVEQGTRYYVFHIRFCF